MKKIIVIFSLLFCGALIAQQNASKNDIIMTANGELLQVKVTKVTENVISFNYPGETVINEIKSDGVEKIVFASGRTQNFGGTKSTDGSTNKNLTVENTLPPKNEIPVLPSYEENSVAIVPLDFKRNGSYEKTLASNATEYTVGLISGKAKTKGLKVLEMDKAIEKLVNAGVNYSKLRQASPDALRKIFGTEFILYLSIDENEKNSATPSDFMADAANDNSQLERMINLRLYQVDNDVETFEVDFSENVFLNKNSGQRLATSGKWKSSLRYLTEQLFASNVLTE
ncbi:hypothetical protein [Costertonia aggregata]|uniref:Uncharacterized protein n=1 Tax=Costertonia aggregata TaxID=343403 RepID=A0A7H9AKH5_9FLAO|nr:hypothetical protein [Costertonia aggregata]QLG43960.1 hypothetical protein HYG79_00880 [Costertonia aggregata]